MAESSPTDDTDLGVLDVGELARLLGCNEAVVQGDIDAGAPVTADGTVNLRDYGAWLNVQLRRRADGDT